MAASALALLHCLCVTLRTPYGRFARIATRVLRRRRHRTRDIDCLDAATTCWRIDDAVCAQTSRYRVAALISVAGVTWLRAAPLYWRRTAPGHRENTAASWRTLDRTAASALAFTRTHTTLRLTQAGAFTTGVVGVLAWWRDVAGGVEQRRDASAGAAAALRAWRRKNGKRDAHNGVGRRDSISYVAASGNASRRRGIGMAALISAAACGRRRREKYRA